jgi:hypothetical protein
MVLPLSNELPLLVKLAWTALVAVVLPVYWREYGPSNFLWFSDIALIGLLLALWLESALIASMMAVGMLALETAWIIDFGSGGRLIGLAAYMFEPTTPFWLRALSGFHLLVPPMMIYLLAQLGYDRRALMAQTLLSWLVLLASYLLTNPADNINWVFGPGRQPQQILPPVLYLLLLMLFVPFLVFLPTHVLLSWLFRPPG